MAHPVVAVDQRRRALVLDDLHLCRGELHAHLDAVEVVLEPPHPVRLDAAQIGRDQHFRADTRVLVGDALGLEGIDHKVLDNLNRYANCIVLHK